MCAGLGAATPSARRQMLHPLVCKCCHGAVRPSGFTWKGAATLLTFDCMGAATPGACRKTRKSATMVLLHPLVSERSHGAVTPSGLTWKGAATLLSFDCRGAATPGACRQTRKRVALVLLHLPAILIFGWCYTFRALLRAVACILLVAAGRIA